MQMKNNILFSLSIGLISAIFLLTGLFTPEVYSAACPPQYKSITLAGDLEKDSLCYREIPPGTKCTTPPENKADDIIHIPNTCIVSPLPPDTAIISPIEKTLKFSPSGLPGAIISRFLPILLTVFGFMAVIFIIMSGIQYITSSGNPEGAKAAQGRLTYAIIGFVVIVLAFAITQIISKIFLGTGI